MNPPTSCQHTPRDTRRTAVGVGAGLIAGAAIGLTMVAPSLTSAATDDTTTTTAAVAGEETPSAVDPLAEQDADRPEPGAHLREALQPLVDDDTITAAQADAVATHLVENRPERAGHQGERRGHRGERFGGDVVADLLGIDAETLRTELRNGSSIANIAEANGIDPQVVVEALVDEVGDHLDADVENGRLTSEEAADRLAERAEHIEDRVNGQHPGRPAASDG